MITGITIENFKGIRDRIKLDLRPITLLFGANSAGKSTVLHAIHYLSEVFERHNLNADLTAEGGSFVDLGGFINLVHGRDHNREIRLGVQLDTSNSKVFAWTSHEDGPYDESDIISSPAVMCIEITIAWSDRLNGPYCRKYVLNIDHEDLLAIEATPGNPSQWLTIYCSHPNLTLNSSSTALVEYGIESDGDSTALYEQLISTGVGLPPPPLPSQENDRDQTATLMIPINCGVDALPQLDMIPEVGNLYSRSPIAEELYAELVSLLQGPVKLVRSSLRSVRYLGPLRETPSRNYVSPRFPDKSRWASGLGAWDTLLDASEEFVNFVSDWLGDVDKLNAGYRLEVRRYKELDLSDPLVAKLITGRAFDEADEGSRLKLENLTTHSRLVIVPTNGDASKSDGELGLRPHDVGVGISQVVPVIVTALHGEDRLLSIEQPELHIHPRLQAEIADLFIEAIHRSKHRFIIETHSEHLILRLLRRIRETEVNKAPVNRTLRTDDLAIYYLQHHGGTSGVLEIEVDVKGEFIQPWPDDFFEIDFYERFKTGEDG